MHIMHYRVLKPGLQAKTSVDLRVISNWIRKEGLVHAAWQQYFEVNKFYINWPTFSMQIMNVKFLELSPLPLCYFVVCRNCGAILRIYGIDVQHFHCRNDNIFKDGPNNFIEALQFFLKNFILQKKNFHFMCKTFPKT